MITLRNRGAALDLLPEIGGAVSRFILDGHDVLRAAPAGTKDVLQTACFPLVPFANRIADGVFAVAGETVRLARNFGDHPHPLHGQGWQRAWDVQSSGNGAATLAFAYAAGEWPWDYTARQIFELKPSSLRITLEIISRSDRAMPFSLGFHPYFPSTPQTRLRADVAGVWLSDGTCIPTERAGPSHFLDLEHGAALTPVVDQCHFGWKGEATITQPEFGRDLVLTASPELDFLHCYIPRDAGFFCVEPVSAMPDAFHHSAAIGGWRVLQPRESFRVSVAITTRNRIA
jgi:aldose 1-epimerase